MKIIGINYNSESSVALIENGEIKYAISQERLNRIKDWYGNPFLAVKFLLKETKNTLKDIKCFSTHGLSSITKNVPNIQYFNKIKDEINYSNLKSNLKKKQLYFLEKRKKHEIKAMKRVHRNITELKKKFKNLKIYDHHTAHAASAYFYSGWSNCYVLTIDGWGDNSSSKFFKAYDGRLEQISNTNTIDSLGYFYGSITDLLGFKPHRHEGKILGLAAFGNWKKAYSIISKMISYDFINKSFKGEFSKGLYISNFKNPNISFLKNNFSAQDIAAAAQKRIEEVVVEFILDNLPFKNKLVLAGGIFANVKINQKISELKNVKDIFIFPNMGDGGLAVGAGILAYSSFKKIKPKKISNVYLGPKYNNNEVLQTLVKHNVKFMKIKKPYKYIAKKLKEGFVVGCFQGRMEFGPRSLGNRSILVSAEDKKVNDWLNKKLRRTEFMPFAPITLKEKANSAYKNIKKKYFALNFMTITCDCAKKTILQSPAAVHVDKTARPQLISKKSNSKIYDILREYYRISGIPSLINTSFNLHEEPIVCSPDDALRAFRESKLDYLYIEDYIVIK
jgi:carbamoyltransferase